MQYDYAPGRPTDCVISRHIRAHILAKQLDEAMAEGLAARDRRDRETAERFTGPVCDCGQPSAQIHHWYCATRNDPSIPALVRRQAD